MPQRVQLTGYRGPSDFRQEQIYDPSRQILEQGNRMADQLERVGAQAARSQAADLEALANFSNTLGKFLVDYQTKQNKKEYDLGLADVLEGNIELPGRVVEEHTKRVEILRRQADADSQVADQLEQGGDLATALEVRNKSRALSGWRAYGQAVGQARKAAAMSETFFDDFDNRDDIKVPLPDGRIITPREVGDSSELNAALAVGQAEFIRQNNLSNINPVILVEELYPTLQKVKAKYLGSRLDQINANKVAADKEKLDIDVGTYLENLRNPETAQTVLNDLLVEARRVFKGNWAEANNFINTTVLSKAKALGRTNPELATATLKAYSDLLINPEKPELGTIYNRFAEEIEGARAVINGSAKEQAAEEEAKADKEIDTIFNTWKSSTQTQNVQESQRAFDAASEELKKLATRYPRATERLNEMNQYGRNFNSLTEQSVEQAVQKGIIKKRGDLAVLANQGYISGDTARRLGESLPEDQSSDMVKGLRPRMEAFVRNQLRSSFKVQGADFESFRDESLPLVAALTDELMEAGLAKIQELQSQGKTTGTAQLQSFLEAQALAALKTERFKPVREGTKLTIPTPGRGLPGTVPYSTGPSGANYSKQLLNRLPKVMSIRRDNFPIDADQIQSNIDALNNGGQPSGDLVTIAKAANLPVRTILAELARKEGIAYTPSSADVSAKKYQENFSLDPGAAKILANPRSTAAQKIRATARITEAKRRRQSQTRTTTSKRLGEGDYGGLAALTSSGEGGFNSVNYGTTSSGTQINLTSMSIGEVEKMQSKGQVFAVGFPQWIPGNLGLARSAAGLSANDKMTPDNQLKMFWGYILNSNKRPVLRDYLLGKNNDLLKAHREMALEWAAVQGPEGYGYYDNDKAGNFASIQSKRVQEALRAARREIMSSR